MSGQAESLLHAIRESPEDESLRLILADWFEDNSDPQRAEFIRLQLRLAGDLDVDERFALRQREKELLTSNLEYWAGPLARKPWSCRFHRGTARVQIQTARLLSSKVQKQAEQWFAPALVTALSTEGTTSRWPQFFKLPLLEELSSLMLVGSKMKLPGLRALAGSVHTRNLRALGIQSAALYLDRVAMEVLAEAPSLKLLTRLNFRHSPLNREALALLTHPHTPWPRLTSLNLDSTLLFLNPNLELLLAAPWLSQLRELSVHGCLGTDQAIQELIRGLTSSRLRVLGLGNNRVSDRTAELIASSAHLAELRELWLDFPRFSFAGARALAESPYLNHLRLLYLYDLPANSEPARILRERFGSVVRCEYLGPE
jgi:uncharacterized protein (TIGR02996 family)